MSTLSWICRLLRLSNFFVLIFILVALWEIRMPRRALTTLKKWRWFNNLSIIAINPALLWI